MKNRQVFKIIRNRLDPWFSDRGFVPAHDPYHRGLTGWSRPHGSRHLNVWCHGDKWQFDPFTGSQFTMEFEVSPQLIPGHSSFEHRDRFPRLLTEDERRSMLDRHNAVVGKLRRP